MAVFIFKMAKIVKVLLPIYGSMNYELTLSLRQASSAEYLPVVPRTKALPKY